jgi:hypothetical protein
VVPVQAALQRIADVTGAGVAVVAVDPGGVRPRADALRAGVARGAGVPVVAARDVEGDHATQVGRAGVVVVAVFVWRALVIALPGGAERARAAEADVVERTVSSRETDFDPQVTAEAILDRLKFPG